MVAEPNKAPTPEVAPAKFITRTHDDGKTYSVPDSPEATKKIIEICTFIGEQVASGEITYDEVDAMARVLQMVQGDNQTPNGDNKPAELETKPELEQELEPAGPVERHKIGKKPELPAKPEPVVESKDKLEVKPRAIIDETDDRLSREAMLRAYELEESLKRAAELNKITEPEPTKQPAESNDKLTESLIAPAIEPVPTKEISKSADLAELAGETSQAEPLLADLEPVDYSLETAEPDIISAQTVEPEDSLEYRATTEYTDYEDSTDVEAEPEYIIDTDERPSQLETREAQEIPQIITDVMAAVAEATPELVIEIEPIMTEITDIVDKIAVQLAADQQEAVQVSVEQDQVELTLKVKELFDKLQIEYTDEDVKIFVESLVELALQIKTAAPAADLEYDGTREAKTKHHTQLLTGIMADVESTIEQFLGSVIVRELYSLPSTMAVMFSPKMPDMNSV